MRRVVFLVQPQVYLLDLAGPAEVFHTARDYGLPYELSYVADEPEIVTAELLPVRTSTTWPTLSPNDIVIVPGRQCATLEDISPSERALAMLRSHHRQGGMVVSVCAATEALGRAGLLDGRRCATHHQLQDELAARYPAAEVVRDVLYTVDGNLATSAGIASGIDLCLHLIATWHGPTMAGRIARALVVYARRNGTDEQVSALLRHRSHLSDLVHRLQDVIDERYTEPLRLAELSRKFGCSERTITRRFRDATGLTPLRYQQALRLERAEHLIASGTTVEGAARAVGFSDSRTLRALRAAARTAAGV
ncbi:GlxA family transcriptional regulator [Kutzneria kofuensis]|uniref:Transcriptional regulator GlxA family with amidase domain n=1 Tax=Kutzneria kofuensis TaxID=103725 RepID=A0A7W9NJL6_9PSEU|nr:DJ-1/PfpI family protein [Kutzneria kofuensis]MBB5895055.1 transcriptional regulator GlxA family with amidase domain [Kutzneria kofuensis]